MQQTFWLPSYSWIYSTDRAGLLHKILEKTEWWKQRNSSIKWNTLLSQRQSGFSLKLIFVRFCGTTLEIIYCQSYNPKCDVNLLSLNLMVSGYISGANKVILPNKWHGLRLIWMVMWSSCLVKTWRTKVFLGSTSRHPIIPLTIILRPIWFSGTIYDFTMKI